MAVPDIPQLSADMKSRIIPWTKTNLSIASWFQEGGQWHVADENTGWFLGPSYGSLAATMYRYDPSLPLYRNIAISTVEEGFRWNLKTPTVTAPRFTYAANPSFPLVTGIPTSTGYTSNLDGGPWGTPDPLGDGDESSTMEAGTAFCWILDQLYACGGIDTATATRWLANLKLMCDWLINYDGLPIWYTNGNYTAHQCLLYAHVSRICRILGDETGWYRYNQAYEQTLLTLTYPFANNPPANAQWSGYGYIVDIAGAGSTVGANGKGAISLPSGTTNDGSGETGHLTETPGYQGTNPASNWDPYYSTVQMDLLATLFTIKRDWRINYLMNAIWNKLEPLMDFTNYTINCVGGSRQGGLRTWLGGYIYTIAMLGRRQQNRTQFTNAHCLGAWDHPTNGLATGTLTNSGNNLIQQSGTSHARMYRTTVATTLHACYLADNKLA